ncbi:MAG TPA: glutamate-5-semialdehyde dehydrogenase [Candidatus Binatia bacterium]
MNRPAEDQSQDRRLIAEPLRAARAALRPLRLASTETKNAALRAFARLLREETRTLLEANARDLAALRDATNAFRDRLTLDERRVEAMARAVEEIAELPDPVGDTITTWRRPNGLEIAQVRVPLGVVGVIYESRPNVTADAAALCLKSGNAVLLRGGSEAIQSNTAIADVAERALREAGLPVGAIQLVRTTDRKAVDEMLGAVDEIDVIIPRGGASLLHAIHEKARVPVIQHFEGICHTYVDRAADVAQAVTICVNAKTSRPGVCNAMETLLVHREIASEFLPKAAAALRERGVELRGCERTRAVLPDVKPATDEDWDTEYLDLILSIRVVDDLGQAIEHIGAHSTGLAEAIVTEDRAAARRFAREVDSAAVYVNASTRFTDGGEFGFGAEIGISTNRLHARGPLGLRELTTYKYVVQGDGQVR